MTENNENKKEVLEEGFLRNAETGKIEPDYEGTIKDFSDGDIVTGSVVRVDRDEVLIDIGYKSEGVIPARELSIRYGVSPEEVVKIGDTIDALVMQKEDKDGRLILSKKRAEYERVWQRLDAIKEIDGTVKGQVIEVVKGGLIVDIGLRGFVPASLVDTTRVKDLKTYIGQEFECKIVELNRSRNNVVLSRRAFLDTLRKEEKQLLLDTLEKGQTVKGTVSSVVTFGAFVDIGGMDGLVHISELSWGHVDHPSEVIAVGDEVTVQILDVDKERNRISLGLKQCQPDPWKETVKRFKTGEIVEGTVMKLVPFGAFVSVADGVEGLIHISELAESRVEFPGDVIEVGQTVTIMVVDVELDRHRLSLSLKQAMSPEEKAATEESLAKKEAETAEAQKPEEAAVTEEAPAAAEAPADKPVAEEESEEAPAAAEAPADKPVAEEESEEAAVTEEAPAAAEAPADKPVAEEELAEAEASGEVASSQDEETPRNDGITRIEETVVEEMVVEEPIEEAEASGEVASSQDEETPRNDGITRIEETVVEEIVVEEPIEAEEEQKTEAAEAQKAETQKAETQNAEAAEAQKEEAAEAQKPEEAAAGKPDDGEETATEKTLRDIESVDRDIEAIDAAELTNPDMMAGIAEAKEAAEAQKPEAAEAQKPEAEEAQKPEAEEAQKAKAQKPEEAAAADKPEPGSLEAILEDMKKESKDSEG